ncbi:copper homeostasis periplasmic binding protein CopC [Limnobacter litoralis]|uniref:Copper resistance protein C n=1 Tax=Limnobacter litoralis TaxID=481366 RepID=A0ABQ5YRX0_9BURK|nr:copper homeostasis periplasmic binding protein CopC [Limnobacter litoralis]GLR25187.1 copper resistance protein C [Limnobacter litoralis]
MKLKTQLFTAVIATMLSTSALAHPKLTSSIPADGTTVASPKNIEIHFSEDLLAKFSGAKLTMTEMPGMAMQMNMAVKVSPGSDEKTMLLTPTTPLSAGKYRVDWRAVSSDTHPMTGHFMFEVK